MATYTFALPRYIFSTPLTLNGHKSTVLEVLFQVTSIHTLPATRIRAFDDGKLTLLQMALQMKEKGSVLMGVVLTHTI